ncbi:transporter substrate-binding domain-containing protein [Glutamicibacter halophytocola]|uniref:Transporter substrate-binding domain-containing protein n=1 Tax=Glutamicibacter halophytocola TaxID=1933880 RepID=A0A5B8I2C8_9MICC|nr:transporter substrate-binding domain-containing protein [Glutamicibacter halophytocola]QDY66106.1 transporter substrate-binding domain-containing protein [Glutamicibacter halophytocola]UUX58208.1 transporter substrate-binding domain-containing protein [Glutamicibacter halophytocola]
MKQQRTRSAFSILALIGLVSLCACADPSQATEDAPSATASDSAAAALSSPNQDRPEVEVNEKAQALVPEKIAADGKLSVVTAPGAAPLSFYATDNSTPVGNDADLAAALADALGLELELVPVSWADWPLGIESGKYEAAISNVTVTEERKKKFDFATYREDLLGFYADKDSKIGPISKAEDVAGLKIIVGSGTNQEKILVDWDKANQAKGLEPVDFQYYDDDSASTLALLSGRADASFGPNATGAYKQATTGELKQIGSFPGGWPDTAQVAVTTKKGSGLAEAAEVALDGLMDSGAYSQILDKWGLGDEGITDSRLNPDGLAG